MRQFPLILLLLGHTAVAQVPDSARAASGSTVTGVVYDSIARGPLAGAVVQLVDVDGTRPALAVTADSAGAFVFTGLAAGRYALGFLHPMLDSLGIAATPRAIQLDGRDTVSVDLAIPSPAQLRAAICRLSGAELSGGVIGVVRDALAREPAGDVTVTAEWLELTLSRTGTTRQMPRVGMTTAANGWFALCNVPAPGTIRLMASRGADSTDVIEIDVPAEGLVRRELYLGAARASTASADVPGAGSRVFRGGDGRLTGVVTSALGGKPVTGARVTVANGPETRTDERGEWTLANLPLGTRVLEIRAVGHYPERRPVDVLPHASPLTSTLSTMRAVLDTVKVRATRLLEGTSGFTARRHSGIGRYVTADDVARRRPVFTSELFRMIPGVYVERTGMGETTVQMRGVSGDRCSPAVYLDGQYRRELSADQIDELVNPREIAGIEIYTPATEPPQFQQSVGGCGTIVIWTKRPARRRAQP